MGKQNRRKVRQQRKLPPQQKVTAIRRIVDLFVSLPSFVNYLLGALASLVTILSFYILWPHDSLLISVGDGAPLNKDEPTYFFFSMPKDAESARYLLPVHLELTNTSKTSVDEVRMIITYDHKYFRSMLPEEAMTHDVSRPTGEQNYEVKSDSAHDYVTFSATFLSPQVTRSFTDGAFATRISDKKAPMLFNSGVGLDVKVNTYSKNDTSRDWNIRYRGLRVKNDTGIELVMKNWYAKQLALEIRRESGFWGYISKLLWQKEIMMYGYSPNFRFIPSQNVFIPVSAPKQFTGYRVWPYSWQLLFHVS